MGIYGLFAAFADMRRWKQKNRQHLFFASGIRTFFIICNFGIFSHLLFVASRYDYPELSSKNRDELWRSGK